MATMFLFENFFIVLAVFCLASLVQGVVGFAFSLIAVPLLSLFFSPAEAVGLNIILATLNACIIFWLMRDEVHYRKMLLYIGLALISAPVGVFFLRALPEAVVMICLGVAVIALTVFTLGFSGTRAVKLLKNRTVGVAASLTSGFLAGAFTAPGPPIVAYLYNTENTKQQAKANTQFFFVVLDVFIIPLFIMSDVLTMQSAANAVLVFPFVLVFSKLGVSISYKLPQTLFSRLVDGGLILLGVALILKTVL